MTTTASSPPETGSLLLAAAREQRRTADAAEARLLQLAVEWSAHHTVEHLDDAECYGRPDWFGQGTGVPLAGPGAPLVEEFATHELAAALGLGPEAGKRYVGHAVELAHRLPRLWAQVLGGDLAVWRARRVAEQTITQVSFAAASYASGELDLADALDLDDAIRGIAGQLADLGCAESLDVRRALAAGELARRQLALAERPGARGASGATLKGTPAPPPGAQDRAVRPPLRGLPRRGRPGGPGGEHPHSGHCRADPSVVRSPGQPPCRQTGDRPCRPRPYRRLRGSRTDQGADGAARPHLRVPVVHPPPRSLDPGGHGCHADHTTPLARGGPTCTCQLAPPCRTHHRTKTLTACTLVVHRPGSYRWTSPRGLAFLRDHTGTRSLNPVVAPGRD